MTYTIYATTVNTYQAGGGGFSWSQKRNGGTAVVSGVELDPSISLHFITDSQASIGDYTFARTYLEFDLSSIVDPINSIQLYVKGVSGGTTGNTTYVAYAGNRGPLSNNADDYGLYIGATSGGPELSTIIIQPEIFRPCLLDITTYPALDPPSFYNIALVSEPDFLNIEDGTSAPVSVYGKQQRPYLIINGSYPYNISGVSGANIIEVSGVPAANIINIMGV